MFLVCFDHNNVYKPKWAPELREPKLIKQCPNHSRILLIVDSIKGNVFCIILTISAVTQEINQGSREILYQISEDKTKQRNNKTIVK